MCPPHHRCIKIKYIAWYKNANPYSCFFFKWLRDFYELLPDRSKSQLCIFLFRSFFSDFQDPLLLINAHFTLGIVHYCWFEFLTQAYFRGSRGNLSFVLIAVGIKINLKKLREVIKVSKTRDIIIWKNYMFFFFVTQKMKKRQRLLFYTIGICYNGLVMTWCFIFPSKAFISTFNLTDCIYEIASNPLYYTYLSSYAHTY